ncbi:serine/threonine-protein phosphatase [Streptomyces sp. NBC_00988]|uniref:PP2C family protein-serine/threonine phosphatase n=1 Tax=Streptomyces sp. NBC_00988 TaxID=2903704 RepID=UPI00386AE6F6|nr:serine/threonine-protein phosphatase [Streptomyces sp. NBC_00988]WSX17748.1 serine/threonine-protein phosphatase [Streptomyces sp. NBC_00988]
MNAALHRLHLLAGRPSLTEVARVLRGAGISRSTVHDAFCSQRLPKWKVIDALVEVLSSQAPGGRPEDDQRVLHEVWLRAAQESDDQEAPRARAVIPPESDINPLHLQRAFLPREVPYLEGVDIAWRYRPASDLRRFGGDWFDAVPLPGPTVALVAGDVMGSSTLSIALMGQLSSALNALVQLGLPPHEALNQLSDQAQRLHGDQLATCVCAVYDTRTRRLDVSNAGHVPPVVLFPDGESHFLDVSTGLPIGVAPSLCETVTFEMTPGTTLFLLTDGLVSSPTMDISEGIERLSTTLSDAQTAAGSQLPPLEGLVDVAMNVLVQEHQHDDAVLLAARLS